MRTRQPALYLSRLKQDNARRTLFLKILFLLVILSCALLMVMNFITIRSLSATRAFINGESTFSKAQKDGSENLLKYLAEGDEQYYNRYLKNMNIILADSLALHGLLVEAPDKEVFSYFIQARNNADDSRDMIWQVNNFQKIPFVDRIIKIWQEGNRLVKTMQIRALDVQQKIRSGNYTQAQAVQDGEEINLLDIQLNELELRFSDSLNEASRSMMDDLMLVNFIMILFIVGIISLFSAITVKRLMKTVGLMDDNNRFLSTTNLELDKFVYSASQQLRAPITSLRDLSRLMKDESDLDQIRVYLALMDTSLNQQDEFIREIINYSRNKRTQLNNEQINIRGILDNTFTQHQDMDEFAAIDFKVQTELEEIFSDSARLKIILNNLVSNAIRFSDDSKTKRSITVRCSMDMDLLKLEVEDNGVGVQADQQDRVFNMFFTTQHARRGSGLGLYIVRETATRLGGSISLISEPGKGCCFTVLIPLLHSPARLSVRPEPVSLHPDHTIREVEAVIK